MAQAELCSSYHDDGYWDYENFDQYFTDPAEPVEFEGRYAIEEGHHQRRAHLHIALRFKTRVPFQLNYSEIRKYVNEFGQAFGYERLFPYVNVRWAGRGDQELEAYLAKDTRGKKDGVVLPGGVVDDLVDQMSQISL